MVRVRLFFLFLAAVLLSACGLSVPAIHEVWDEDIPSINKSYPPISGTAQIEFEIKKRVYCDLREAVIPVQKIPVYHSTTLHGKQTLVRPGLIPKKWGAAVAISLQVDETTALNPGVALNDVLPNAINKFGPANTVATAQSFSLGFGATLSTVATRIDKFNPYYTIDDLSQPFTSESVCHPENDPFRKLNKTPANSSPFLFESDLGIKDWLYGALIANTYIESDSGTSAAGSGPKTDAISYEIKFVIVSSGSVTPTWKLVKVAANTAATPFFSTGRTRTHDLIITIGPNTTATMNNHLASQIAAGVNSHP